LRQYPAPERITCESAEDVRVRGRHSQGRLRGSRSPQACGTDPPRRLLAQPGARSPRSNRECDGCPHCCNGADPGGAAWDASDLALAGPRAADASAHAGFRLF
jgi:hypothetical protein